MQFQKDKTEQTSFFFSRGYRDLISKEDEIWSHLRLFDRLDFSEFEQRYTGEGQIPIDPKVMCRTLFYGLQKGMVSVRKLAEACEYDVRYIILSGALKPDRRTFDRFFIRHEKALESFFKQVTEKAMEYHLVGFDKLAIDGTRLKANTKTDGMSYDKMTRAKEHIAENLQKLREDLAKESEAEKREEKEEEIARQENRAKMMTRAQEQIEKEDHAMAERSKIRKPIGERTKSLHDPEAISMSYKNQAKAYLFGYNAQVAVDEKLQIIVSADLHDKATDYQALEGLLDQAKENTGQQAQHVLCDQGYTSVGNICHVYERGMEPIFATGRDFEYTPEDISQISHGYEQMSYDAELERYRCLAGHKLNYRSTGDQVGYSVRLPQKHCESCPLQKDCSFFQQGNQSCSVPRPQCWATMKGHVQKSRTQEYKEIYRRRKAIVEPVFGNIKSNKRFMISVVGRAKVKIRFLSMCIAHNLEKILHHQVLQGMNGTTRNVNDFIFLLSN